MISVPRKQDRSSVGSVIVRKHGRRGIREKKLRN